MVSKIFIVTALAALASALPVNTNPGVDTINLAEREANALVHFYIPAAEDVSKREANALVHFYIPDPEDISKREASIPGAEDVSKRDEDFYIPPCQLQPHWGCNVKRDPNALVSFYIPKEAAAGLNDLVKRSPNALVSFYIAEAESTTEKRNELDAFYGKDVKRGIHALARV